MTSVAIGPAEQKTSEKRAGAGYNVKGARRDLGELSQHRLGEYLDVDPRRAQEKYRLLREKLVKYFDHNRCLDPEDLADESESSLRRRQS